MDWQPISTAPKDGTPIIVWCDFEDGLPCQPAIVAWTGRHQWPWEMIFDEHTYHGGFTADVPKFWTPFDPPHTARAKRRWRFPAAEAAEAFLDRMSN